MASPIRQPREFRVVRVHFDRIFSADRLNPKAVQLQFVCPLGTDGELLHGQAFHRAEDADVHGAVLSVV